MAWRGIGLHGVAWRGVVWGLEWNGVEGNGVEARGGGVTSLSGSSAPQVQTGLQHNYEIWGKPLQHSESGQQLQQECLSRQSDVEASILVQRPCFSIYSIWPTATVR